ncbi:hydroxymethylbilane synthase [Paenibacillus alkalitolerans]|uniref:hydroxymethylbilane synthase n=1 Tax=Paenibacillus alkalitolerans TaxID=2799335 RepID=UPI0018F7CD0D|nr:hydroxymethylbilane synthase [Paenibacillus alkalitolerans]
MTKRTWVVGSRQSALALTQTQQVLDDLKKLARTHGLDYDFEIRKIVTKGDRILDVTLSKVGGKGLFVKEIEQAMFDGEIDFAVHSMKDMPAELPDGLTIGCIPQREDPRDAFISRTGAGLTELPQGSLVGTSSLRRSCQLRHMRPDFAVEAMRGNIDSRLKKLEDGVADAIVLAAAGLHRMGWDDRITEYLAADVCVPAVGQGALAIECREGDGELRSFLKLYDDERTAGAVAAERAFLAVLNGGCQVPIGAHAVLKKHSPEGGHLIALTGVVGSPDGSVLLKESLEGSNAQELGARLGEKLLSMGAERILADARSDEG